MSGISSPKPSFVSFYRFLDHLLNIYYYYYYVGLDLVKDLLNKISVEDIIISSSGQPTRGGPSAWGLGEVLTTPLRKKYMLRITHKRCFLWRTDGGRLWVR
jgi:hypothetical protein